VEAVEYSAAHILSAGMVVFSFVLLLFINYFGRKSRHGLV